MTTNEQARFKPALGFSALTRLFDPVVAVVSRERTFKASVIAAARLAPGDAVLDLGCGTGTLALLAHAAAPAAHLTGFDADPVVLASARSKAGRAAAEISFDQGMSTALPYADASFDAVLSTLFFHHLSDADKRRTATEVARVLRPGGRLIVADLGRPQDRAMRVAVRVTTQLLDGTATTASSVDGELPGMLTAAGLVGVTVVDRLRTPTGTIETVTARR